MAKKLKVGDIIRGLRITKVLGPGMMAIAYTAEAEDGTKVFLKQYKSPSPTVVWYPAFVEYQRELSRRIETGKASRYVVQLLDAFEEIWGGPTYFAAFEFVENGRDLEHMLAEERDTHARTRIAPARDTAVWSRHVTWAKVFMAAIAALHESRIVHADLKPANVFLIADASLEAGYQLKLIDTDFSLLSDRRAPWHGFQGYVGTDNYRSPEHMARGGIPSMPSDIFTCGLILHELLVGVHPYWSEDPAAYAMRARAHALTPPLLQGVMPAPAQNGEVSAMLHRCLSPDPTARPTAAEVRAVLSGRAGRTAGAGAAASPGPARTAAPAGKDISATAAAAAARPTGRGATLSSASIRLVSPSGRSIHVGVRTTIGKALLRPFGADAEFWDERQCTLERRADGQWMVNPVSATVNDTLVNGQPVVTARPLHEGDVLAVGRHAKGITKLPLTAHAG